MSNKAAVLTKKGATQFVPEDRPLYQPEAREILVKNHAIATNPVDWKMQDEGIFIENYPTILGSDLAGTVEAVGSAVTLFKKGDRVTGFADVLITRDSRSAAFQNYSILREWETAKVPESISLEEASILPMAVATAGVGIFSSLQEPRPSSAASNGHKPEQPGAFLVWGASSSVGSSVVQIAKSLGYAVYAINSPKHNTYIQSLGADACFNYNDPDVISKVLEHLKSAKLTASIGYDAIAENGSAIQAADILSKSTKSSSYSSSTATNSKAKLCITLPWPESSPRPDNVETFHTYAAVIAHNEELGQFLFNEWLTTSLANGTFKPSPQIRKVESEGKGIAVDVQKAVDLHRKGVSGVKLVVTL